MERSGGMQRFDFDILDSTNDEAKRLLAGGKIAGVALITARGQTAGRGTRGRAWSSPRDAGLYFSYVCRNHSVSGGAGLLPLTTAYTLAAGVACVDAVQDELGVPLQIKPVNDLIWNGGKVGGILTEAFIEGERLTALIIGIGINVLTAERVVPEGALPIASLAGALSSKKLDMHTAKNVVSRIADYLGALARRIAAGEVAAIETEWRRNLIDGPDEVTAFRPDAAHSQ